MSDTATPVITAEYLAELAPMAPQGLRALALLALEEGADRYRLCWLADLYRRHTLALRFAGMSHRADDVDRLADILRKAR